MPHHNASHSNVMIAEMLLREAVYMPTTSAKARHLQREAAASVRWHQL